MHGLQENEQDAADALFTAIRVLPAWEPDAWRAGAWRRDFAARGRTLHQADCLIAAATSGIGTRLATGNPKDFPMSELVVEEWSPSS